MNNTTKTTVEVAPEEVESARRNEVSATETPMKEKRLELSSEERTIIDEIQDELAVARLRFAQRMQDAIRFIQAHHGVSLPPNAKLDEGVFTWSEPVPQDSGDR